MALDNRCIGLHTSSTGRGGFVTYYTDDDPKGTVNGGAFWQAAASNMTRANLQAREAVEDFVRKQSANPGAGNAGGVPLFIIGNDSGTAGERVRLKIVESGIQAGRCAPIPW